MLVVFSKRKTIGALQGMCEGEQQQKEEGRSELGLGWFRSLPKDMSVRGSGTVPTRTHLQDFVEFRGKHHVTPRLQFAGHECLLAVELAHRSRETEVHTEYLVNRTFPSASCKKVSSAKMIATSIFGFAAPLYTVPVFFKSIVHTSSFPASFFMRSSKIPFA